MNSMNIKKANIVSASAIFALALSIPSSVNARPSQVGGLGTLVAPEVISIGQQSNPSPVVVKIGDLATEPEVKSTDAKLAKALQAKWGVEAHCQTQLGKITVKYPKLAGIGTVSEPKKAGKKGFKSGSFFNLQSYNVQTVKNVCMDIAVGGGHPGFSDLEVETFKDQFNANGGFLVDIPAAPSDKLQLTGSCLNAEGTPTLAVNNKSYPSQPITVACCNADQTGSSVNACKIP